MRPEAITALFTLFGVVLSTLGAYIIARNTTTKTIESKRLEIEATAKEAQAARDHEIQKEHFAAQKEGYPRMYKALREGIRAAAEFGESLIQLPSPASPKSGSDREARYWADQCDREYRSLLLSESLDELSGYARRETHDAARNAVQTLESMIMAPNSNALHDKWTEAEVAVRHYQALYQADLRL